MKSIILEFILPILVIISVAFFGFQIQEKNKYKELTYIVSIENRSNSVDITFIEPSVKNITSLMVSKYYVDSLKFQNKSLYFMVIPKEVHKAICDSSVNVLRNPRTYMKNVKFYEIIKDSIQ